MFRKLIQTNDADFSLLILRLTLGGVIFPHGAQKLFGWFGGAGFSGTMEGMSTNMGIPKVLVFLVIMAESLGSLSLIIGFISRFMAFGIACVMTGAIAIVHWQHGFFMNWQGQLEGEGFEFHLLAIGIAIAIMIKGGGLWSIDSRLYNTKNNSKAKYW